MALQILGVDHHFGSERVLSDVSIHVRDGDCYGLVGHNGAGKTTLLRILLGLLRPRRGRVIVDGMDAALEPREAHARIGALAEFPSFNDALSGRRNLLLYARLGGLPRREAEVDIARVLAWTGLEKAAGKPVHAYSQGMRRRLGIALSLTRSPRHLVLDEPANGLDPDGMAEVRELLRRLVREEGLTVLLSSHLLAEIEGLCNRVGVLREGRILFEEATATLLRGRGSRYRLRTAAADDALLEALGPLDLRPQPAPDGTVEIELRGRDPAALLSELVQRGLRIEAFAPRPTTLEEIYLATRQGGPAKPPAAATSDDAPATRGGPPGGEEAAPDARRRDASAPPPAGAAAAGWARQDALPRPERTAATSAEAPPALPASDSLAPAGAVASADGRATAGTPPEARPAAVPAVRHGFLRVVRFELARAAARPLVLALLGLPALAGALNVVHRKQLADAAAEATGTTVASTTDVTAFEGVAFALTLGLPLLVVLLAGFASQAISADASRGTLRNLLLAPVTRRDVLLGKAAATLGLGVLAYAALVLAALGTATALFDFGDLSELLPNGKRFPLLPAEVVWPELPRALLLPLLPLAAYATLGFLAGALLRSSTAALALAVGSVVVLDLARPLAKSARAESWLPSTYLPSALGDRSSFVNFYTDLSQGYANATYRYADTHHLVPLLWNLVALALAAAIFFRRPVT